MGEPAADYLIRCNKFAGAWNPGQYARCPWCGRTPQGERDVRRYGP